MGSGQPAEAGERIGIAWRAARAGRARRGQFHPVHEGAGRRRGHRAGAGPRTGAAHGERGGGARDRPRGVVGRAPRRARAARGVRRARGGRLGRRAAARAGRPRRRGAPAAAGDAVERRTVRAAGRGAGRAATGPSGGRRASASVPGASFTVAKWEWLREHDPAAAAAAKAVRLPHDFLTERLSGAAVTDRGDVSGTGWWASGTEAYDEGLLGQIGLDPTLLPAVLGPGEAAGAVRDGAGLRAGAPGRRGHRRQRGGRARPRPHAGARGAEPRHVGDGVRGRRGGRPTDASGTVAGFAAADGGWLPLACTLNCTLAVDKVAALLGRDREDVEPGGSVAFLPFLDGERTPNLPYASGLLHGPAARHDRRTGPAGRRTTGRCTRCWTRSTWCWPSTARAGSAGRGRTSRCC